MYKLLTLIHLTEVHSWWQSLPRYQQEEYAAMEMAYWKKDKNSGDAFNLMRIMEDWIEEQGGDRYWCRVIRGVKKI